MRILLITIMMCAVARPASAIEFNANEHRNLAQVLRVIWPESSTEQRDHLSFKVGDIPNVVGDDRVITGAARESARALRSARVTLGRGERPSDEDLTRALAYLLIGARAMGAVPAPTVDERARLSRRVLNVAAVTSMMMVVATTGALVPLTRLPVESLNDAIQNLAWSEANLRLVYAVGALQVANLAYQFVPRLARTDWLMLPGSWSVVQNRNLRRARALFFDTFAREFGADGLDASLLKSGSFERKLDRLGGMIFATWSRERVGSACERMILPRPLIPARPR